MWKKAIHWLVYSHVWIALGATGLAWLSAFWAGANASIEPILLVFLLTLGGYNVLRWMGRHQVQGSQASLWMRENTAAAMALIGLATLGTVALFFSLDDIGRQTVVFLAALYAWYAMPGRFALREWPYAKTFFVALTWALATVWIPLRSFDFSLVFWERFLFIWALTIPFDIKDEKADAEHGGQINLSILLGWKTVRGLSMLVWLAWGVVSWFAFSEDLFPILLTWLIGLVLLCRSRPIAAENHYFVAIDGVLLLFPFLVFCFHALRSIS